MASKTKPRIYIDSNILIPIFKGKEIPRFKGMGGGEGPDRTPICVQILQDAKDGKIELYTSWATMIECVTPPTEEARCKIGLESVEELFQYEFLLKCDVDRFVGIEAQQIQFNVSNNANYQNQLKKPGDKKIKKVRPMDAIHAATAVLLEVDYFFTYDDKHLIPLNGNSIVSGLKICFPFRPWDQDATSGQTRLFMDEEDNVVNDRDNSIGVEGKQVNNGSGSKSVDVVV